MDKKHKSDTSLWAILEDSWARELSVLQTVQEARAMGYVTNIAMVKVVFKRLEEGLEQSMSLVQSLRP